MTTTSYSYAVVRKRGPSWDPSRAMHEQDAWDRHASFMNQLVATGFVKFGGPLGDGEEILLLVQAASDAAIVTRLREDPWTPMGLLEIASVKRWEIRLGDDA